MSVWVNERLKLIDCRFIFILTFPSPLFSDRLSPQLSLFLPGRRNGSILVTASSETSTDGQVRDVRMSFRFKIMARMYEGQIAPP